MCKAVQQSCRRTGQRSVSSSLALLTRSAPQIACVFVACAALTSCLQYPLRYQRPLRELQKHVEATDSYVRSSKAWTLLRKGLYPEEHSH